MVKSGQKLFGLIGKKISYSASATYFNKKFHDEGIDALYELFPLENIDLLPSLIESKPELVGLNVTVPYKEVVIPFTTSLSEEAKEIGAVNVLKIHRKEGNFILTGYNTDALGFRDSLIPLLRPEIKKALILGTGGASKAVSYVLNKLGIKVSLVSRQPEKGDYVYSQLTEEIMADNLLIVNTTPVGTFPDVNSSPKIPFQYLTPRHICFDLIYNPDKTLFLKEAESRGAKIKNGKEMHRLQALASWEIWNK